MSALNGCPDCQRLRERIKQVQDAADQRNAELHRKVAYYESIRSRVNRILRRFEKLTPLPSGAFLIEWFADAEHTQPIVANGHLSPGSLNAFWVAFDKALAEDQSGGTT